MLLLGGPKNPYESSRSWGRTEGCFLPRHRSACARRAGSARVLARLCEAGRIGAGRHRCVSTSLPAHPPIHLFALPICPSASSRRAATSRRTHLPICLSAFLPIHLSAHVPICPSACLPICLPLLACRFAGQHRCRSSGGSSEDARKSREANRIACF